MEPSIVIDIIQSKSYAHRACICAALSSEPCSVVYDSDSEDVRATRDCLQALRARGRIMFYFDVEAETYSEEFIRMMNQLEELSQEFKYLGSYVEVS